MEYTCRALCHGRVTVQPFEATLCRFLCLTPSSVQDIELLTQFLNALRAVLETASVDGMYCADFVCCVLFCEC